MDLVKILLQAEISKDAVSNIQKQIKKISDTAEGIKIKVDIDNRALKNIESINKKIQNQIGDIKVPVTVVDIDKSIGQIDKLVQKTDRSTGNLSKIIRDITLTNSESLRVVDSYNKKTGDLISTTDELTINYKKQRQELEKLEQLQSKSLWGISKEKLDNIGKESDAIKQLNKYYKEQADLAEKISLFKQKMLGGDGISGELDIFAYTHKGKYDKSAFNQIKNSIESINLQTPDAANKIKQLNTQWSTFKKTVSESSNIFTRTMENMGKFLRFYLAGGLLVGFVRDIKKGIDFIKELDKDLTQISIITGMTKDETLKLAQSYSELGKEIGKTVTEISKVNTELVRQGLSLEESQSRMDTILKLSATGAINTDQSLKIITSAVNALGEEGEHTADVMLKASQISASSVEEIGEAFTKTASSAKSTGMSLTELNAIISGLVETTQESPSSLGNSIKTLLARFNKINEETGEVNESLNDVQEAFESVGISFLDSEKQIRPVYELLTDLDKVWGDLDKNTKMYIATQAAGTRQQNRFLAIMDNFARIQEINNELMESGGTLVEGYATYLNSVEAASNKAKASLENLWVNAINSETIRNFYLLSSTVMDAIDKIGLLKFTIAALSTVLLLVNKRWRSFSKDLVTGELFSATKQMSMFTNQVNALGVSFDIAKIKAVALQGALSLGLGIAISFIINKIIELIGKTDELNRKNEELVQSYRYNIEQNNSNIKRLKELSSEYDSIKDKINNQIELNEDEKRTIDELIQINPSLLQGYNERGEAIIDTTQNIRDMIEELERANELENIRLLQGGQDLFVSSKADISDAMSSLEGIKRQIDEIENGTIRASRTTGEVFRNEKESLSGLRAEYDKIIEVQGKNSKEAIELSNRIKEKEASVTSLKQEMRIYEGVLRNSSIEVQNALFAHIRLSDSYKNLSNEIKRFVGEYIKTLSVSDFDSFIDMQIAVDEFIQAMKSADFAKISKEYQELVKQFNDGELAAKEFDIKVQEITKKLLKIEGIDEDLITKFFKGSNELENLSKQLDNVGDSLNSSRQESKDFKEEYEKITSKLQDYYKILDELNSKEGLSVQSKQDIITKHQELLPYLDSEKELRKQLIHIIEEKESAQRKAYMNMLMDSEEYYNTKIRLNAELVEKLNKHFANLVNQYADNYEVDFNNFKSLADAKEKIELALINSLSGAWATFYRRLESGSREAEKQLEQMALRQDRLGLKNKDALKTLGVYHNVNYGGIADELERIIAPTLNFRDINMSKVKDSKKGKEKKDKKDNRQFLDSIDAEIRAIQSRNDHLEKTADLLQEQLNLAREIEGVEGLSKQYELTGQIIEHNTKLLQSYKDEQDAIHKKANDIRKQYSKYNIDSWFDANAEQTVAYINQYNKATKEQQEEMQKVFSQVQKLKQAWMGANDAVKNVLQTNKELTRELENHPDKVRSYVRELIEAEKRNAYLELEMRQRRANEELKQARQQMESEVEYYQSRIKSIQNEIDWIQESERARQESLERAKRLEEIAELQNRYYTLQYKSLSSLTEEQAKALGLEREREQYLERQAKIQELLVKLENTRKEKNIQQLTKQQDGTWQFEYVADEREIDNINKQIEDLQKEHSKTLKDLKERTLNDLKRAQEEYDEWERQNRIRRQIEEKQRRIQEYQDEITDLQNKFAEKERLTNEAFEREKENLDRYYMDIDILTDERMKELYETFDGNWSNIYSMLVGYFDDIRREYEGLVNVLSRPLPAPSISGGGGGGGSGGGRYYDSSDGYSNRLSSQSSKSEVDYGKGSATGKAAADNINRLKSDPAFVQSEIKRTEQVIENRRKAGMDISAQLDYYDKLLNKYSKHKGGVVGDGSRDLPEVVNKLFNTKADEQIVKAKIGELFVPKENLAKYFVPNMQKLFKSVVLSTVNLATPKVPNTALAGVSSRGINQNVNVKEISFPNVKDAKEIEGAIKSLSTYANQWANRK